MLASIDALHFWPQFYTVLPPQESFLSSGQAPRKMGMLLLLLMPQLLLLLLLWAEKLLFWAEELLLLLLLWAQELGQIGAATVGARAPALVLLPPAAALPAQEVGLRGAAAAGARFLLVVSLLPAAATDALPRAPAQLPALFQLRSRTGLAIPSIQHARASRGTCFPWNSCPCSSRCRPHRSTDASTADGRRVAEQTLDSRGQ